jgi:uncharacterized membrane protein YcjF (UPF0283 family)
MPESESERLKRLRDKQVQARDPMVKERKYQREMSVKEKRMQKPINLAEDWGNIPYVIKAPLFGLIFGVIGTVVLVNLWSWQYAVYVGAGATVLLMIFAAIVGNALDLREDIKKHLK